MNNFDLLKKVEESCASFVCIGQLLFVEYKILRNKISSPIKKKEQIYVNEAITTIQDKQDIVNSVNEHFVNISNMISWSRFYPESFSHLKQYFGVLLKGRYYWIDYTSIFEIKMILDKVNPSKAAGLDFIGPLYLKLCVGCYSELHNFYHQPK